MSLLMDFIVYDLDIERSLKFFMARHCGQLFTGFGKKRVTAEKLNKFYREKFFFEKVIKCVNSKTHFFLFFTTSLHELLKG